MRAPAPPSPTARLRAPLVALGFAVLAGLALGACSSSDPAKDVTTGSSAPGSSAPGTVPGSTPGTSATASGTTPGTGSRPGTTAATTPGSAPVSSTTSTTSSNSSAPTSSVVVAADNAAYCTRTDTARKEFSALDPASPDQALATYKAILGELTALSPAALQADWTAVNAAVQAATSLEELSKLGTGDLDAATKRIDTWSTENCGFSLSDG